MKSSAVVLAVLLIPIWAWSQTATFSGGNLPTFYAALYGVVADDTNNQCNP